MHLKSRIQKLLGAKGIATRSDRTLLGAPGRTTRSDQTLGLFLVGARPTSQAVDWRLGLALFTAATVDGTVREYGVRGSSWLLRSSEKG